MVRAKVTCVSKTATGVTLVPVVGGSAENDQFFSATPAGEVRFEIVNEAALANLEVGREYFCDLTPVEK